jgi:predicted nucleic acid-binding protein
VADYYLETSALVKLYVREAGTERLLSIAEPQAGNGLAIVALSPVEFRSALRKRQRIGDVDEASTNRAIAKFERHLSTRYKVAQIEPTVLAMAITLVDRHPLRAYDAIQLAGCIVQRKPSIFVCADQQLIAAAIAEGLAILDPLS